MSRLLLVVLLVVVAVEQGFCALKFSDENIPAFPEGGLVIYAPFVFFLSLSLSFGLVAVGSLIVLSFFFFFLFSFLEGQGVN